MSNSQPQHRRVFTVGELRQALEGYPDDWELIFGDVDGLSFYRVKQRGPALLQIEFNEAQIGNDGGLITFQRL
jgi:hypothetical protein